MVRAMRSRRLLFPLLMASSVVGLAACGGTTQFAGGQPFAIAGTPPPPPPPPPQKMAEAPKPPPRVELKDNRINFNEKIQFEVNKAIIKEESFSLLHDIAEVIKQNPQVKKLSIEGHASAEGNAAANKKLSDQRAKAVMDHLVKKEGIDAARLAAKGWGSEKPIADNATEEGREKNRRVEFLVLEQDVTKKKVEIDPVTGKEKVIEEQKTTEKAPEATPAPAGSGSAAPATPPPAGTKPATAPGTKKGSGAQTKAPEKKEEKK